MAMKRPDMRAYFSARIDRHVNGMMATQSARTPADVVRVDGDVTSRLIMVTMRDGTRYAWSGGRYGARKVNGCYAPLMPRAAVDESELRTVLEASVNRARAVREGTK